jgi:tetratricopeptide (TPR) repeat protein
MKQKLPKLLTFLAGLLLGCLVSAGIIWFMLTSRSNYLSETLGFATPTVDIADPAIYKILEEADMGIHAGNPQKAIDLILPEIEGWSSPIDKATGYQFLAIAEYNMGHQQQAIPYAKKMVEYNPGAFSLMLLGEAYDASGDIKNALSIYQQILALNEPDPNVDYEYIRQRVVTISRTLGTPVP